MKSSTQQKANEEACRLFGHMPEPRLKAQGWGEMVNEPTNIVCRRCGAKLA